MKRDTSYATRSALLAEAAKFQARVYDYGVGRGYDVSVMAPVGRVWNDGELHELVGNCPDGRQRSRNLVRSDLIQRMRLGVKPCERADCEWCGGAQ